MQGGCGLPNVSIKDIYLAAHKREVNEDGSFSENEKCLAKITGNELQKDIDFLVLNQNKIFAGADKNEPELLSPPDVRE